jgi:hypothetical protein
MRRVKDAWERHAELERPLFLQRSVTMPEAISTEALVRARLDAAGIPYSEEELQVFITQYGAVQQQAASLYIPETRYEEPNLVFSLKGYLKP